MWQRIRLVGGRITKTAPPEVRAGPQVDISARERRREYPNYRQIRPHVERSHKPSRSRPIRQVHRERHDGGDRGQGERIPGEYSPAVRWGRLAGQKVRRAERVSAALCSNRTQREGTVAEKELRKNANSGKAPRKTKKVAAAIRSANTLARHTHNVRTGICGCTIAASRV